MQLFGLKAAVGTMTDRKAVCFGRNCIGATGGKGLFVHLSWATKDKRKNSVVRRSALPTMPETCQQTNRRHNDVRSQQKRGRTKSRLTQNKIRKKTGRLFLPEDSG
jgi:hypothetical protein